MASSSAASLKIVEPSPAPGSGGMISLGDPSHFHYRIICVQHEGDNDGYLDAREGNRVYCSTDKSDNTTWYLEDAGAGYVYLCNKAYHGTSQGPRIGFGKKPYVADDIYCIYRSNDKHNHTAWKLIPQNDGTFRLKNKHWRGYGDCCLLDGNGASKNVYRSAFLNDYTKWRFAPVEYDFKCFLKNFKMPDLQPFLDGAQRPILFTSSINADVLGAKFAVEIGENMKNSFTWGLNQEISIGVEMGVEAGIPGIGSASLKTSVNASVGAHQEFGKETDVHYKKTLEFTPTETGNYRAYMVIWKAEDVQVPFTCEYMIKGKSKSGSNLPPTTIDWYAKRNGLFKAAKVADQGDGFVKYHITGTLTASMSVNSVEGIVAEGKWKEKKKEIMSGSPA